MPEINELEGLPPIETDELSGLPVVEEDLQGFPPVREIPEVRALPPETVTDKIKDFFLFDDKEDIARAQNAFAISETYGVSLTEAYKNHDIYSDTAGLNDRLKYSNFAEQMVFKPVIATGLLTNPASTILGVGTFSALAEAENAAISHVNDEDYKIFQHRGLSALLPDNANRLTTNTVETFDFIGKALIAGGIFKISPKIRTAATKQVIEEYGLPRKIFIDGKALKQELQTGGILPIEELDMVKSLGFNGAEYRRAINRGVSIEVPPEKLIIYQDRPWYAKTKKLLGLEPFREVRKIPGEPVAKIGEKPKPKELPLPRNTAIESVNAELKGTIPAVEAPTVIEPEAKFPLISEEGEFGPAVIGFAEELFGDAARAQIVEPLKIEKVKSFAEIQGQAQREAVTEAEKFFSKEEKKAIRGALKRAKQIARDNPTRKAVRDIKKQGGISRESMADFSTSAIKNLQLKFPGLIKKDGVVSIDEAAFDELGIDANRFIENMLALPKITDEVSRLTRDIVEEEGLFFEKFVEEEFEAVVAEKELGIIRQLLEKKPKARRDLKKAIHDSIGKNKVGEVITLTEKQGLKLKLRAEQKGFKAGVSTGKLQKAAEIREKIVAKKRFDKAVKQIKKEAGKSIDLFSRDAIQDIQEGIDFAKRSKRTLEQRQATKDFLARAPEEVRLAFPKKLLAKLDKKPLNDFTIEELESLTEEVNRLRKLGRLKKKLKIRQRKAKHEADVSELSESVLEGEDLIVSAEPILRKPSTSVGQIAREVTVYTKRPVRIFRKMDGMRGGPHEQIFYDRLDRAVDKELSGVEARKNIVNDKMTQLGLSINDLSERRTVARIDVTLDEAIDIYMGTKNPRKHLALIYGNNLKPEQIEKIVASLSESEKAFGDALLADYNDPENYDRIRETKIAIDDEDLGFEKNYSPMRRVGIDFNTLSEALAEEILHRKSLKKGYVGKKFTISRIDVPEKFQKPITLGAYSIWLDQVSKQEKFITQAQIIKDLQRIVSDESYKSSVEQKFGKEYNDFLQHYVNQVADPDIYRSFNTIENASRQLRQNVAVAYLSFNLVTIGKQLPSMFLYLGHTTPDKIFSESMRFVSDPVEAIDFVRDRSPQMRHRTIERELEELKRLNRNAYDAIIKKVGRGGMKGIYWMDRIATSIGWRAVYEDNIERFGELEAAKIADKATFETQPQAHSKDLAQLYTTNEFLNWATQFTNQLNNIFNIATEDIPLDFKNSEYGKAYLRATGLAISALFIWGIANKSMPDSTEDVQEALTDQAINAMPLLGKNIMAAKKGYSGAAPPAELAKGVGEVLVTDKKMDKKIYKLIEIAATLTGAPWIAGRRIFKAIKEEDLSQLLGGKKRTKKIKPLRR